MTKYRKKPVVVEAVQFTRAMAEGREPLPAGVQMISRTLEIGGRFPEYADDGKHLVNFSTCHRHVVTTLEGDMDVQIGDWIITGVKGEHYPCKPDIFEMTYEPAAQAQADDARDAECYRMLRKGAVDDVAVVRGLGAMDYGMSAVVYTYSEEIDGDDLDAAIDVARQGEGGAE